MSIIRRLLSWLSYYSPVAVQRRRVRRVALTIIRGLRDGTLTPDPPLGRDPGLAWPQKEARA